MMCDAVYLGECCEDKSVIAVGYNTETRFEQCGGNGLVQAKTP